MTSTIQTKFFACATVLSFPVDTCLSNPACSGCCQERTRSYNHCEKGIFLAQCANVGKRQQKKAAPALGFHLSQLCTPLLLFKNAFKLPYISYLCAVENPSVNGLAKGMHGLHLPLRSAQQHHCCVCVLAHEYFMGRSGWYFLHQLILGWIFGSIHTLHSLMLLLLHPRAALGSLLCPLSRLSSLLLCPWYQGSDSTFTSASGPTALEN